MSFVLQMLMQQLQNRNPKSYQLVQSAMQNGGNPSEVLHQIIGNATLEQKQNLIKQARNYGCPDSILKQIQNMK